jgi:L-iditol 2-dehydrogenase
MRAARLVSPRQISIFDEPAPQAGPGEVLVRVQIVAICPSDLGLFVEGHSSGVVPDHPMVQGHEFSGVIAQVGEGVQPELQVGTRVAVEPSWHCGDCDMCRRGLVNLCRNIIFPSFPQQDGGLREFIACPASAVCPVPDSVGPVEAALVEPLGVAVHAAHLAELRGHERVVIQGAGPIGLSVLQLALAAEAAAVAVVEPREDRRALAAELGAEIACSSWENVGEAWVKHEDEPDVVFECSGDAAAFDQALHLCRPAGKVIVVGIPHPDGVSFEMRLPRRKELTVVFSRRSRDVLAESVDLAARGVVNLSAYPVRKFPLERTQEAMETALRKPPGMLRAVVEVS